MSRIPNRTLLLSGKSVSERRIHFADVCAVANRPSRRDDGNDAKASGAILAADPKDIFGNSTRVRSSIPT